MMKNLVHFINWILIIFVLIFWLDLNLISQTPSNNNSIDYSKKRPSLQGDPGFFLNDWKKKTNPGIKYSPIKINSLKTPTVNCSINFSKPLTKISKYIFGNNLGHWTSRKFLDNDRFIFNLKDIGIPVVRFPGGNASNDYFWDAASLAQCPEGTPSIIYKSDFKKTTPPKLANQGNFRTRPEDYYELLMRTKSTGSICVNYSMALYNEIEDENKRVELAAEYAASWVRDVNIKRGLGIKFWEIGNENWGKWQAGYNVKERGLIDPKKYGEHCRLFITKMKEVDPTIKIGVVGYQKPKSKNPIQRDWNKLVLPEIIDHADFYILHDYYAKFGAKLSADEMLKAIDTTYSHIKVVNEAIEKYTDKKANHLPIALTEFNTRSNATISKNDGVCNVSHTAGIFFSHALGEIIRQGYGMAMMWDFENGYHDGKDHGMFSSTKEKDVNWLTPHPSYYHYYMYNNYFGDHYYEAKSNKNDIRVHSSTFSSGEVGLVVVNISNQKEVVKVKLENIVVGDQGGIYELFNEDPKSRKTGINGVFSSAKAGGPDNLSKIKANTIAIANSSFNIEVKPYSANYILIEKK
jgi:alpha-L-arabinofuranosidase